MLCLLLQWMADHVDLILVFFDPIGEPVQHAVGTRWRKIQLQPHVH